MKQIINKLKDAQGYLWYSDRSEPEVIDGDFEIELDDEVNPFILEGFVCNTEYSVSIKYVDGNYIINKYSLTEQDKFAKDWKSDDLLTFMANRIPGKKQIMFRQRWRLQSDPLCKDMDVLRPAELVFLGFK